MSLVLSYVGLWVGLSLAAALVILAWTMRTLSPRERLELQKRRAHRLRTRQMVKLIRSRSQP